VVKAAAIVDRDNRDFTGEEEDRGEVLGAAVAEEVVGAAAAIVAAVVKVAVAAVNVVAVVKAADNTVVAAAVNVVAVVMAVGITEGNKSRVILSQLSKRWRRISDRRSFSELRWT
jgi:hypothetical protein